MYLFLLFLLVADEVVLHRVLDLLPGHLPTTAR
jgi:hypothetical protein